MDEKKSQLTEFLDKHSPVDTMEFKVDSKYLDFTLEHTLNKGTKAGITIDLNSLSEKPDERAIARQNELADFRLAVEKEKMLLELEQEKLKIAQLNKSLNADINVTIKSEDKKEESSVYNTKDTMDAEVIEETVPNEFTGGRAILEEDEYDS